MNTAILLIDGDLAFAFWLGRALDQEGYQAFPARSVPAAAELSSALHLTVSLVIINHALAGAETFVEGLRRSPQGVKVVAVLGEDESVSAVRCADVAWRKPAVMNEAARVQWVHMVNELFVNSPAVLFG